MTRRDAELALGLGAAYAAFAGTFRGPQARFWQRMTATGLVLGGIALATEPGSRRIRPRGRDVVLGLASAAGLYGIFQVGDRLARRVMPRGGDDIGDVYALRRLRPASELALRLAAVIGPAEEIFWRGFVQGRASERLGRWRGAIASAAAYGGAHVATGNLTLIGAAATAGAYWSVLRAAGLSLGALIVSHIAWDIAIFLVVPTQPPES